MIKMSEHLRQWFGREELAELIRSVVGVFDHCEIETVRRIKGGSDKAAERTGVATEDLQRMITALDDLFPGTVDSYINYRLESQAVRKEEARRGKR
jgi:hypothetical protein